MPALHEGAARSPSISCAMIKGDGLPVDRRYADKGDSKMATEEVKTREWSVLKAKLALRVSRQEPYPHAKLKRIAKRTTLNRPEDTRR